MIGGRSMESGKWIESINPSHRRQIVGRAAGGNGRSGQTGVLVAKDAFPQWRDTPAAEARRTPLSRGGYHATQALGTGGVGSV